MSVTMLNGTEPTGMYDLNSGSTATEGSLAGLNASGKVLNAADAAGLQVIGLFSQVLSATGKCKVQSGVFLLSNSGTNALSRTHRGKVAYVENATTVSATGGTNSIVAGLVVDVCEDGVWVDVTNTALAAARALLT